MCQNFDHNEGIDDGEFWCELVYVDWDRKADRMHVDIDRNGTVLFY